MNGNLLMTIRIYYVLMLHNRLKQVDYKKKLKPLHYVVFFFGFIPRCPHDIPRPMPILSAIDNTPGDPSTIR